jgi:hypothetical protein
VLECQEVGWFWGTGNADGSIPEWKEFAKIVWFDGAAAVDWADIQFVGVFGMAFGPGKPKK